MLLQHNLFFNIALYVCHKVNIPIKGKDFKQQIFKKQPRPNRVLVNTFQAAEWGWADGSAPLLGTQARGLREMVAIQLLHSLSKGGRQNTKEGMFSQESRLEVWNINQNTRLGAGDPLRLCQEPSK